MLKKEITLTLIFAVLFYGGNIVGSAVELLYLFVHDREFAVNTRSSRYVSVIDIPY